MNLLTLIKGVIGCKIHVCI